MVEISDGHGAVYVLAWTVDDRLELRVKRTNLLAMRLSFRGFLEATSRAEKAEFIRLLASRIPTV